MNTIPAFARRGMALLCLMLPFLNLIAEDSASELHELYTSGRYYDCYRASAEAVKSNPKSAVPHFYAALALSYTDADLQMRKHVRKPYGKALYFLEQARQLDPQGRRLGRAQRGLAQIQRKLVEKASEAFRAGNPHIRAYFDRLAAVFNTRQGTWKNYYHHGRFLADSEYDFKAWDNPIYRLADTGRGVGKLSREQRAIIYLHNLCRMNPPLFRDTYLKQYLGSDWHNQSDSYVQSLIKDLAEAEPRQPYYPDPELLHASESHARDLAAHRMFAHESSDGTSFSERLRKLAPGRSYCGENCAAGYNTALESFMGLLIDRGVPSLGHRENIMRKGFKYIGVGVIDPDDQWKIWVFDFAGR